MRINWLIILYIISISKSCIGKDILFVTKNSGSSLFDDYLIAIIDDNEYVILPKGSEECISIESQGDFDGNGSIEALVLKTGCGPYPGELIVASVDSAGYYMVSDTFGYTYGGTSVENHLGFFDIIVQEGLEDSNICDMNYTRRRFRYSMNNIEELEQWKMGEIVAETEFRSCSFLEGRQDETLFLLADIDGDGVNDSFEFKYWERWGSAFWSLTSSKFGRIEDNSGIKRLGILKSSTLGVKDIVLNCDIVLKWDGTKYVEK